MGLSKDQQRMESGNMIHGPWNGVEFWKSYKENKEHGLGDGRT